LLEAAGIREVEAGVPAIGGDEKDAILRLQEIKGNVLVSTWNRVSRDDVLHSFDCRPDVIHIGAPVSGQLISSKLGKDAAWLRRELRNVAELALERGYRVTVGFEDASRADPDFMLPLARTLVEAGVDRIRFADTLGIMTPSAVYDALSRFDLPVGIHAHNDLGMAVANSLAACQAGAVSVDATLFGIGERAGNCNLRAFVETADSAFDTGIRAKRLSGLEREAAALIWKNVTEKEKKCERSPPS
jgi:homocitrate synthase NifV